MASENAGRGISSGFTDLDLFQSLRAVAHAGPAPSAREWRPDLPAAADDALRAALREQGAAAIVSSGKDLSARALALVAEKLTTATELHRCLGT